MARQEPTAQTELYEMYKTDWFMICLRYQSNRFNAEDCLQNALIMILTKIAQFNADRGDFGAWSSKIVVNENLMFLRKNKWNTELHEGVFDLEDQSPKEESDEVLSMERLTKMIQKLPVGYRTIFNLYVLEGYDHVEISQIMDISVGTSKSQLSKARKLLQHHLEVVL